MTSTSPGSRDSTLEAVVLAADAFCVAVGCPIGTRKFPTQIPIRQTKNPEKPSAPLTTRRLSHVYGGMKTFQR
jgi:hypothetical protein